MVTLKAETALVWLPVPLRWMPARPVVQEAERGSLDSVMLPSTLTPLWSAVCREVGFEAPSVKVYNATRPEDTRAEANWKSALTVR